MTLYLERQAARYIRGHKIVGQRTPVKRQSAVRSKAGRTKGGKMKSVQNIRWQGRPSPSEAMMHFPSVSDFPPIFEKCLDFRP